jgi:predicted nucleic acid-binding Zn ribbon protein
VRRGTPRPLGHAVTGVAEGLRPPSALAAVQAVWAQAAGPTIAAESDPVSERAGMVTVACSSAVWAQELDLLAAELIARLEAALEARGGGPRVRSLRFVVGPRETRF